MERSTVAWETREHVFTVITLNCTNMQPVLASFLVFPYEIPEEPEEPSSQHLPLVLVLNIRSLL